MAIPEAKKLCELVKSRAINLSEFLLPNQESVRKQVKRIRDELHRKISEACGIGPLPIWFDRQEVMLATYYRNREYEELKLWIKFLRYNFADWNRAKKKLAKAKLNLPAGLNVSKKLMVKNGLDATAVMKKSRAKNRGWMEKRRATLCNVEREYFLAEEGLNWQVASICLFSISLYRLLNVPGTVVPIGDIDDFLSLEVIHAIFPLTEGVLLLCESDDLLGKIKERATLIHLQINSPKGKFRGN
ncbi:uncharacterized protein LOC126702132 [Quercus robur]|uniref:uncharacterized protein LOC126702132 n=1 Tax=Quercus robur TaxID=38942 RepID=UPI002163EFCA|nr:uncharacterized protein LOC126702132 [Quercus robur]